jgi:hypothetical protein
VSFVYFAKPYGGGSLIKIGRSKNPVKRAEQLHCDLLRVIPDHGDTEWEVHEMFAHLRTKGEWFRAGPELIRHIDTCGTPEIRGTRAEYLCEVLSSARETVKNPTTEAIHSLEMAFDDLDQYDAMTEIESRVGIGGA